MRLIRRAKTPEAFDATALSQISDGLFPLHFTALGRSYYTAVAGNMFCDQSFMLEDTGKIVALVECDIAGGKLGRFSAPCEVRYRPCADYVARKTATRLVMAELAQLQAAHALTAIELAATPATDPDGLLATSLLSANAAPLSIFHSEVDLALDDKAIVDDFRSGHRQQMRWGEKNLRITCVDRKNPDRALFEQYRTFHAVVAGRVTRGQSSWDAMFQFLETGYGDLVAGFLGDDLVSATMVLDAGQHAVYASGVYDRSRFDLPLAHYPLTMAILRAKRRGRKYFDIGESFVTDGDAKKQAIGYFKRGFSARLNVKTVWRLSYPAIS